MNTTPTNHPLDALDTDTAAPDAVPARRRRRPLWITAAALAAVAVITASVLAVTAAVEYTNAMAAFDSAVDGRADAYAAQDDAIAALRAAEEQAVTDFTQLRTIGTTLTDTTVTDPATRAAVLDAASVLADAAWLDLDPTGLPGPEQTPVLTGLFPDEPLTEPTPADDLDALSAQTARLTGNTVSVRSYTELVIGVTTQIHDATEAGIVAVDAVLDSAATQGQALVYDLAPDETAAVVAAAAALTDENVTGASLEDKAALVTTFVTAVQAAWAQQQAVLAAEQAEAERFAAEQQRQNQSSKKGTSNGSRNNGHTGGGNPGTGGSTPGSGGSNPGGGGGSNWRPLKLTFSGSVCSGTGGGQEVTYGSTLMVPGSSVGSYSTYEIPGYGWGVTWKCKHW